MNALKWSLTAQIIRRVTFFFLLSLLFLTPTMSRAQDFLVPVHIKKDTNLTFIAREYCHQESNWKRIAEANALQPPYLIIAHSTVLIPLSLLRTKPLNATIATLNGSVVLENKKGKTTTAHKGTLLHSGERLRTGDDGSAHIIFPDNRYARVGSNSSFILNYIVQLADGAVKVDLTMESGFLSNLINKKLKPNDLHRIRTPLTITGVRGTEYRIKIMPKGKGEIIETLQGEVAVDTADTNFSLQKGQGGMIKADGAVTHTLPEPPKDIQFEPVYQTLPLQIIAPRHNTAKKLRLRITTEQDRHTTLRNFYTPPGHYFILNDLPDGTYYSYLSAIDKNGLESADSGPVPIVIRTKPAAPVISGPTDQQSFWKNKVTVTWLKSELADRFQCQLAKDRDFRQILDEKVVKDPQFTAKKLDHGSYFFRVRAISEDDFPSLYSAPITWNIINQPELQSNTSDASDAITLQWFSKYPEAKYDLQVAKDFDFHTIVVEKKQLETTSYTLEHNLHPGFYYVHIRIILDNNTIGPWIEPQKLVIKGKPGWAEGIMATVFIGVLLL